MAENDELQAELQKIEAALRSLETLLSGEALSAAQKPLLEKRDVLLARVAANDGAAVQGNNNLAVGARGVVVQGNVGGDVVTGEKITQKAGKDSIQIGEARDVDIKR